MGRAHRRRCGTAPLRLRLGEVCEDLVQGRKDLRRLGAMNFEGVVFAHGNPITENAVTQFQTQLPNRYASSL